MNYIENDLKIYLIFFRLDTRNLINLFMRKQ